MRYPALDVHGADPDIVAATADDFSPTAIDEQPERITIFFSAAADRDRAHSALTAAFPAAAIAARDVDDEDWARRSQENLQPIVVGRITVAPPWASKRASGGERPVSGDRLPASGSGSPSSDLEVVILPSMGFGTGHHATTRLCLAALQTLNLQGRHVVDVGTGSGVLAIAGRLLGAAHVTGLDYDADAIHSAIDNLALNPAADRVTFVTLDLRRQPLPRADVITANLTGALLIETAPRLLEALTQDGTLIASGIQASEADEVKAAFTAAVRVWEQEEAGWVGLGFNRRRGSTV